MLVVSFLFFTSFSKLSAQQHLPTLIPDSLYGPHPVGFRFLQTMDYSRAPLYEPQSAPEGRIVPIYFWYPASAVPRSAIPMKINDYMALWGLETDYNTESGAIRAQAKSHFQKRYFWSEDTTAFSQLYALEYLTRSYKDVRIRRGKHPLILLIHNTASNWHFMAELLASHGFAVAAAALSGTYDKRLEEGVSCIMTELRDAEFALGHMANISEVNTGKVVVIGHSLGALPAAALGAKHSAVKGVVSLDGVIADPVEGELLYEIPYYNHHRFTTPLLHLMSTTSFSNDLSILQQMQFSDRYVVKLVDLPHADFAGQGLYDHLGTPISRKARKEGLSVYHQLLAYTLGYCQQQLGDHPQSFQREIAVGQDAKEVAEVKHFPAIKRNYTFSELMQLTMTDRFDDLFAIYEEHKAIEIKAFSYICFHDVGMQMLYRQRWEAAAQWFSYFAESYPKATKAQYLYGAALARLEKNEEALAAFQAASQLLANDAYLLDSQRALYKKRIANRIKALQ